MPKVLITGATGLLGREIYRAFKEARWDVIGTGYSRSGPGIVKIDLVDEVAVQSLIESEKPSIIIHSAAERSPDAVAADRDRAHALNVTATHRLAQLAASRSIPLLYISTDYVFPGVVGETPYAENASPRPTNDYGQLKFEGEQAVLFSEPPSPTATKRRFSFTSPSRTKHGIALGSVLRVPVLYGPVIPTSQGGKGNAESAINLLVDKVREAAASGPKTVSMDHWQRRFPTLTSDVGVVSVRIAARWLALLALADAEHEEYGGGTGISTNNFTQLDGFSRSKKWPPVLHFSGSEVFTKYQMCQMFADILGLDISSSMTVVDSSQQQTATVQRPYDTQLGTSELEKLLGDKLSTTRFRDWWEKELLGR